VEDMGLKADVNRFGGDPDFFVDSLPLGDDSCIKSFVLARRQHHSRQRFDISDLL